MIDEPDTPRETPPREGAPKSSPDAFTLRAAPRRIVRFKRSVVIGGAAAGAAAIAGVAWLALGPATLRVAEPADEPVVTDRHATADAVADLPGDYGSVPQLGPPLPGDLGRAILDEERGGDGASLDAGAPPPSAEEQALEAERQRQATQAGQARESGVMVRLPPRPKSPRRGRPRRSRPPGQGRDSLASIPNAIRTASSARSISWRKGRPRRSTHIAFRSRLRRIRSWPAASSRPA